MITIQHNVLTGVIISGEINMPTAGNVVEFFTPPVWFVDLDVDPNDSKKWLYEFEVPSEGVASKIIISALTKLVPAKLVVVSPAITTAFLYHL